MSDSKLPAGWSKKPLGALVSFQKGRKTDTSKNALNGYARYLGASGLSGKDDGFADMAGAVIAEPSDLLMLWDGERSGLVGYMQQGVVASTVSRLTPTDEIDSAYLYYKLVSLFDWIQARRTGTGVPHVPKDLGKILDIIYPKDKSVQRNIATILRTIDNQIDATQALIDKYTAIKQGMMADLFSRGIDPETKALRPTFEEAPELYYKTPLGMLPKGWETKSLDSVVESLVDGPFGSNLKSEHYVDSSPYRVVRLQNIVEYQYYDENKAFIPAEHFEFLKRNTVFPGDVLIAGLGEERYPVGRSCCYPADFPPAVNKADCFRARGINGVLENTYLMLFLNSEVARHQIRRLEQGVTRPRVNTGNLKKIIVCLPSIEEQNLATEKYQSIQNVVGGLEAELKKLTSQKAGLMQDLLTGKVPVPA
ncbi:restriction endonuclease subunit S [Vibrio vulnificus]|nr:restriction endonuclease subunit S [Vibrio vulnificus]